MRAVEPRNPHLGSRSAKRAVSLASVLMLLSVAAFSVMTSGCSDDDDDNPTGGNDAAGLGGQTYTDDVFVGGTSSTLVIVTRDGGASSPASTGGMMAATGDGGTADGLLLIGDGVRQQLTGSYDSADPAALTLDNTGGVTFDGTATQTFFNGDVVVPGIPAESASGGGRQVNAPLINLLGTWDHESTTEVDCGGGITATFDCPGTTRMRAVSHLAVMDTLESCEQQPLACTLADAPLDDDSWNGGHYQDSVTGRLTLGGCPVDLAGTLDMTVTSTSLSSTTVGTVTLVDASCGLPTGTQCSYRQTVTASRCSDCWRSSCN